MVFVAYHAKNGPISVFAKIGLPVQRTFIGTYLTLHSYTDMVFFRDLCTSAYFSHTAKTKFHGLVLRKLGIRCALKIRSQIDVKPSVGELSTQGDTENVFEAFPLGESLPITIPILIVKPCKDRPVFVEVVFPVNAYAGTNDIFGSLSTVTRCQVRED